MATSKHLKTSDQIFPDLFHDVQVNNTFPDSKTFADAIPKLPPEVINSRYEMEKKHTDFSIRDFVEECFELPFTEDSGFTSDTSISLSEHLNRLWPWLTKSADRIVAGSSLIPLKHPYVIPGGRFREIYYWDSFFTMLGLIQSGKMNLVKNMLDNFCSLIDLIGHIPNGNRTYFISRSQPPFFCLMVEAYAQTQSDRNTVLAHYLPWLEKEYAFWMKGKNDSADSHTAYEHTVQLDNGEWLNRYYDTSTTPRQESYLEDVEIADHNSRPKADLFQNIRAACASGWDFSSRWLEDPHDLGTIVCLDIIPIDLNCLLWKMEDFLASIYRNLGNSNSASELRIAADKRRALIQKYLWDDNLSIFGDYNFKKQRRTGIASAAMSFPLYFEMVTSDQALMTAKTIENSFLQPGGIVTTLNHCGQQWDAPNGWAPLQWITVEGLRKYNHEALANEIVRRWCKLNEHVYKETGKMMEKYDVEDPNRSAGGGEYPVQDGFGWSNGVYLDFISKSNRSSQTY